MTVSFLKFADNQKLKPKEGQNYLPIDNFSKENATMIYTEAVKAKGQ